MSIDRAKEFIDLLHSDSEVRRTVHDAAEKIVECAKAKGFHITREDISAALKEHWLKGGGKDSGGTECSLKFSETPGY